MASALSYCPNSHDVMSRLRALYERRSLDRVFAVMATPSKALADFAARYSHGYCEYPDLSERLAFWDARLREQADVLDDGIPSAYLSECDQGLYGGMVGGNVQYMAHPETGWVSSMVAPLLEDWSELEFIAIDAACEAFRRFGEQLAVYRRGGSGKFGISHFILIDGLNFVFELFGATKTYLALYEAPEMVHQAIDVAFDLNVKVQQTFFGAGIMVEGGTCSNMAQWLPGRIVSESIDPFHMTCVDDFERWGRGPAERIIGRFDGGVVHIHGNGRHLLEAASLTRGLKAMYVADDRGYPRAFDILPEVRRRVGDLPLVVSCLFDDFQRALVEHTLTGGVLYQVEGVPDVDAANRAMDDVRAYHV